MQPEKWYWHFHVNVCLSCSLGASHDGPANDCNKEDMWLMAPYVVDELTSKTLDNSFTFSYCSIMSFKDLLIGGTDR